jgi:hypothetical protein
MSKYLAVALVLLFAVSAAGKKKPKGPDPVLCAIKTVFVAGNNSAADWIRSEWQRGTNIAVVNSAEQADAILEVNESSVPVETYGRATQAEAAINVILRDKSRKQLWADSVSSNNLVILHFRKKAACDVKWMQ